MPQDVIGRLVAGFAQFRQRHFIEEPEAFSRLVTEGQSPKVLVVACCDSRVDPTLITTSEPGELFVVRNVANLVPPSEESGRYHGTSAALEFAVLCLNVEHVVVLGHARCGGIRALMARESVPGGSGFVNSWMDIAGSARDRVLREQPGGDLDAQAQACEQAAIRVSLDNLMTFSWVRDRVAAGRLQLHGWYFDLDAGDLLGLDAATDRFRKLL